MQINTSVTLKDPPPLWYFWNLISKYTKFEFHHDAQHRIYIHKILQDVHDARSFIQKQETKMCVHLHI